MIEPEISYESSADGKTVKATVVHIMQVCRTTDAAEFNGPGAAKHQQEIEAAIKKRLKIMGEREFALDVLKKLDADFFLAMNFSGSADYFYVRGKLAEQIRILEES